MAIQKSDIIKQVAQITGFSQKDTGSTIDALLEVISKNLKTEDKIPFIGFGAFNAKNVAARKGRNPQTGKEITIAARRAVTFSAGAKLKDEVNS